MTDLLVSGTTSDLLVSGQDLDILISGSIAVPKPPNQGGVVSVDEGDASFDRARMWSDEYLLLAEKFPWQKRLDGTEECPPRDTSTHRGLPLDHDHLL